MYALGQKQTPSSDVRFTPKSRHWKSSREMSGMWQKQTLPQRRHAKRHLDK